MKLSVATNWDEKLLEDLSPYPVCELFGSLSNTPVGGGRPSFLLKDISLEQLGKYIRRVHQNGWKFNYLLNSICMGNREHEQGFKSTVLEHLGTLHEIGVDCITVASPYMIEFVKKHFPKFVVKVSIFLDVDGVAKAKCVESLGADNIKVSIMRNRDFEFLRELRKAVKCDLTLLVNQACLFQCPYTNYHGNINAHASVCEGRVEGPALMYCLLKCSVQKLKHPEQLIRSRWIRPEDLSIYEELGYDTFKISGREMSTERIVTTTKAYATRCYNGNLLDIMNGVTIMEGLPKKHGVPEIKTPYVDNNALNGFLEFFTKQNCWNECFNCNYCKKISDKVVNTYQVENEMLVEILEYYGKSMIEF